MTFKDEETTSNNATEAQDWIKKEFTCPECASHKLVKCLGGQVVYALVDEISYTLEEYVEDEEYLEGEEDDGEEDEDVDLEEEVAYADVSVQSRPDGTELWDYGVDDANDSSSWFRCYQCGYVLHFEDGSLVEEDYELARWLILADKKSQQNES
ncbi:MAG: hypothetical protein WBG50_09885 [Desulfomonilaceae bacterium]